jgi:hypothetical protein
MSYLLKQVIQDLINDRTEQAQVSIHDYIVAKTQEVAGLSEANFEFKVGQTVKLNKRGDTGEIVGWGTNNDAIVRPMNGTARAGSDRKIDLDDLYALNEASEAKDVGDVLAA